MNQQFNQRLILLCLFVFSFFLINAQNGRTGPASAIPINVIPSTGVYDNLPANGTANSITGLPFSDSRDRWFRVTLPPNRTISVSTCGGATNFNSEVFIVDDDGSTWLALDGSSCAGILGVITNFTVPGSDPFVYVVVEGQEIGMEGDFFLAITSSCPAPPTAANQNFCNTTTFTARVSNLVATGSGGTLNWYTAASGGSALATTTAIATGTYYVAEANAGCVGGETPRTSISVVVNPTPTVNGVADQVLCNNAVTNAVNFTGSVAGTVYNWTNNNTNIGLGANGTGNIAPFNATNTGPLPDTATITVTPSYTANGFTCTGTPRQFRIIVYPSTITNPVTPQVICNGAPTAPITFSSTTIVPASNIVYNWTNNTPSIGLAASGSGNIPSFAATNTTNAPVVATVTVTPTFTYQGVSCVGTPSTFTITVHPTATITPISNQTHCRGVATSTINFTSPATGGTVTYVWTNNNTAIGLGASGTGNIPSFTTTHTTNSPIVSTITVTPTFTDGTVTCVGTAATFTITVNPTTSVAAVANKVYCAGTVTSTEVFTGPVTGTVFSWSNDNTAIGLAASGTGDLPSFTTANTTSAPILATITVTSATPDNCAGTSTTFTITVYPSATVNTVSNQLVCTGANTTAVNFSSPTTGGTVTYDWTNNNTSIGLAASGTGNISAFAAVNAGTAPAIAMITVTPTYTVGATVCTGTPTTFTITVNPTATVTAVANQVLCNGDNSTAVNFTSPATGGPVTYTWTNSNTAIGLPANGSGNMTSFAANNTGSSPISATITVTPTFTNGGVSCVGTPTTFTITVNPTATINAVSSEVLCNGATTTAVNFTSTSTGGTVTYNWTNNAPSIGLAATGSGNIAAFTAVNNGAAPIVATITVTPTFTNAGTSCVGTPITFTITVNPTAIVTPIGNQTLCNGTNTTAVNFSANTTGGSVTYNWTNSNTTIGLAASGSGNIPSFIAVNTGTTPVTATITVTPVFNNAGVNCTGTPTTFTITVDPSTTVNAVTDEVLCNNVVTIPIVFTSPVAGTTYSWTNNNTSIGLNASGTGNLPSFTTVNTTNNQQVATITVTPTAPNGCSGTPITFTISVNPVATVTTVSNQVVCAGANTTAVNFSSPSTGGTVTYAWSNNNTSIGLPASGTGNIASFAAVNAGTTPVMATITVTPTYTVGAVNCVGTPTTFTITVNPTATVGVINNQVLCNGDASAAVNFTSTATGGTVTYNWTNDATSIGLPANGTGNVASFNAINNGTAPVVATITVTPTFTNAGTSCVGTPRTFTITVNPTAVINAISNVTVCNNATTAAINFSSTATGGTVTYDWTNTNTTIGLAASGSGNIAAFIAVNNGTAPVVSTITVTPTFTNAGVSCIGTPITFTITVNPTATVNPVANQTLCSGDNTTAVTFSGNTTGGSVTYNWTNSAASIGLAASGSGNIPAFAAINTGATPVTATITVTPVFNNGGTNCTGTPTSFTITVNPTATVNAVANQVFCGNTASSAINFSGAVAGTTFNWVNDNLAIGLAANGSGNIPSFTTANNFVNQTMATITVTPVSPAGCVGTPVQFTITIMPVATVNMVANQVLCNGSSTNAIAFGTTAVGGTVTYNWTNSAPSIGIAANGTGNIPSFTATNTSLGPVTATIVVTPTYTVGATSCVGLSRTFTITVNPTVTVNVTPNQVLCNTATTTPITFTTPNTIGAGSNIVYNWVNNNPSIGLAANGSGNIGSFTAVNNTTVPQTATVTVTPVYTNMGVTCTGTISTFTITVNPTATVNTVNNQILCNGTATTAINFSSPNSGGTIVFNWTNNNPSIGLAATGSGNIASFIATNTSTVPVTANIIVTPVFTNAAVNCTGTPINFNITVQPSGVVNAVPSQVVCANTATTPVVFSSPISGTTYTWVNNNPAIGLAATGAGNIPSFMAVNTTNTINATLTVTPHTPFGCTGAPITFVYTINPIPTMNQPLNQVRCNGAVTDSILFSSPNGTNGGGNIVYNWTNSAPSIGIPASGTGNILPFAAINTGTTPVVAIITVTPSVVNSNTCVGIPRTFSITVNPTAVVNAVNSQTVCAGQPTAAVNFTGPVAGTFYTWTNSNTAIGLAANGTGNIPSFVAQNNTLSTITGTVTVTPNTVFGCVGTSRTFDYVIQALSVAPTAIATSIAGPTQMVCDTNRTVTLNVVGGGLGTGAVWRWYKDACGGTPIGTGATLPNIDVTQTTTFYVRAEGTCSITACASVTVQVAKLITHVRQHWNDVLFFDNSSNNFVTWQWFKNGVAVPGATLQNYSENGVSLNGQYYCVATDKNGTQLITCPLNAIANGFYGVALKVMPNPVIKGQQFKVQSSLTPAQLQGANIIVTDVLGTVVSQTTATSTITTIQAPATGGMYVVSMILRNGQRYSVTALVK